MNSIDMLGRMLIAMACIANACLGSTEKALPAPILSPIGSTANGVKIKVEQQPKDKSIQFEFRGITKQSGDQIKQGPDERNEWLITNCEIVEAIVSYTKDGFKSAFTQITLPENILSDAKPKEPKQQMVDGKIQLTEFAMDDGWEDEVTYWYKVETVQFESLQVPDDGIIKVGCNTDRVGIYAENKCQQRSQLRDVKLYLDQCPPAPKVDIIKQDIEQIKLIVKKPLKSDSIRFSFLVFNTNQVNLVDSRLQESNELTITGCNMRQVVVWYDDTKLKGPSIATQIRLNNYGRVISKSKPQRPTQRRTKEGKIQLSDFYMKEWKDDEVKYFYTVTFTHQKRRQVPANGIIEVECNADMIDIWAEDTCGHKSLTMGVKPNVKNCPAAPNVRVIGITPYNAKIIVDSPPRDGWNRFNFLALDARLDKVDEILLEENNEISVTECGIRSVVVWYDDMYKTKSISTFVELPDPEIEHLTPQEPKQQLVGNKIQLMEFQIGNSEEEVTYYYFSFNNSDSKRSDEKSIATQAEQIIEVDCSVKRVDIIGVDKCRSLSETRRVKIVQQNKC